FAKKLRRCVGACRVRRQHLPPAPRPRQSVEQTDHVPGDMYQAAATLEMLGGVAGHFVDDCGPVRLALCLAIERRVDFGEQARVLGSGAAEHHAIYACSKMPARLFERRNAAVDPYENIFMPRFKSMNPRIIKRRYFSVFFG